MRFNSIATSTSLFLIVTTSCLDAVAASAVYNQSCTVDYRDIGNAQFRYYETTSPASNKCTAGSNPLDLVCMPELNVDLVLNQNMPGRCEYGKCVEPRNDNQDRVTICHRTCSETNPWVRITIDQSALGSEDCKHLAHSNSNCNGKNLTLWGPNTNDFVLKYHGTKQEHTNEYWDIWEPGK